METVTYSVKIIHHNRIFCATASRYRKAVTYYMFVIEKEWQDAFRPADGVKSAVRTAERLTLKSKQRPTVRYDFGAEFYKFPSYLRRSAIAKDFGMVSSYHSNHERWENADPRERGAEPVLRKAGMIYPAMYRDNCFVRTGTYTARLKVWIRNTWDWIDIKLRKSDVDYILHHCSGFKECVPTLQKRGKNWYLDFTFQYNTNLHNTDIREQTILAVDLGINSCCTCAAMRADGTVIGRKFLKLPREYDCLRRRTGRIKRAQRHGSHDVSGLWKLADGINDDIASKTAAFIMDAAALYHADTVVFEHLDLTGKKRGSKKQRLALWKARKVQDIVQNRCHRVGMRISRICAWNTSRLAFDGSGKVMRGNESARTGGSYSVCEFQNGRIYNCDLNAAYNIGARYYIRELTKSIPVTEWQRIQAKVPVCAKRSTCTLSDLIRLFSVLYAAA